MEVAIVPPGGTSPVIEVIVMLQAIANLRGEKFFD
jgi:hypothetical protein